MMNNNNLYFYPGALYAKRLSEKDPVGSEYSWQFIHPAFETNVPVALRDNLRQFQWKSGKSVYRPIIDWQKISSVDVLIVRYLDDGPDTLGRPHTLRIEMLLVPAAEAETAIRFLNASPVQ